MINDYIYDLLELKKAEKELKAKIKEKQNSIREYLTINEIRKYSCDAGSVALAVIDNNKLNEERAIEVLDSVLTDDQKNRVYVYEKHLNEDALAELIAEGAIASSLLEDCVDMKEPTYRITAKGVK